MEKSFFEKLVIKMPKYRGSKAKIKLYINDDKEIYNKFSILTDGNRNILENDNGKVNNNNIIDYLKRETENIPGRNNLSIIIEMAEKVETKIEFVEKLIKETVKEEILINSKKIKRMNRNSFILTIIGMILIGITQILPIMEKRYSINEFIIVMSWVFMWKAVELIFFERIKLIAEIKILVKILYSEIKMEE
jgi:hypothetical protein